MTGEEAARLVSLLQRPTYELTPLTNVAAAASALPEGATVSVTALPSKGMVATVDLATELAAKGFRPVPHLSARLTTSRAELEWIIGKCRAAGISEAFVVGGDAGTGEPFPDGLALLRAMNDVGHPFTRIGVPGYPEGHPSIPEKALQRALRDKEHFADWVTTQMTFSDKPVRTWVADQRNLGLRLPIVIGIPGVAEMRKLIGIASKIGVGDSKRFLSSHRGLMGRLVRPGGYAPDELLVSLGPLYNDSDAGIAGLHLYTLNQVETTERWRREFLEQLEAG